MDTFLGEVCQKIYDNHKDELDEIAIIIPNRRASVYIHKHLSEHFNTPFFAPKITTINEWVDENTADEIISQTELLFLLFDIYVEVDKEEAEDFDSFLKWGKIILSDFDEIDRYNVSPKEIFRDLRNIKDIDNWSFDLITPSSHGLKKPDHLSDGQKKYADLWDRLPIYYEKLNQKLEAIHTTYQGRAYQDFAKRTHLSNPSTYKHYYFVGFNALSRAEEQIFENLTRQKIATVYFDVDKHYINNFEHEAGHFYRKLNKKNRFNNEVSTEINKTRKSFEIIETAQQVAQAKIAGNIIKDLTPEQLNNTAIVLADETLLIPLSKSLPIDIQKANITMGYPIKYSHLKSLFDLVFDFQHNFKKFNSDQLYHKTLLRFIDHPFIQVIIKRKNVIADFEKGLIKANKVFINHTELTEVFPELKEITNLLSVWHDKTATGFKAIEEFIQVLYTHFKEDGTNDLELEILYHFSKGIAKFKVIWEKHPHSLNLKSFKKLFEQFWQNESLSFLGNPIEGLQIMGILETRTLDFENLIILSMNEGNLPKSNFTNSLIPRELKLHHHLPIEQDRDAIFAHHFYRLIHRAKNIYITYNSSSKGLTSGEKSRFITQIENELKDKHDIKSYTYSSNDVTSDITETNYSVNDKVTKKLNDLFAKGLSPSALNTFISCPLDFYYKYILGLREGKEVEENIEASTFGTMIHNVLERVYKDNFLTPSKAVTIDVLTAEKKNLAQYLEEEYLKEFTKTDMKYGQNRLSFDVSVNLLNSFIDEQIKELRVINFPIFIKELEEAIEANFVWNINGVDKAIKIKGNADRIEQFGSEYRIIDYKSGKCDTSKVSLPKPTKNNPDINLSNVTYSDTKGYARQLLMYAIMFQQQFPQRTNFSAGIISMINIKEWVQNVKITGDKNELLTDDVLDLFKEEIKGVIESMYDSDFIYAHNDKAKYCEYCGV
jgi:ATP-dependent helicase/nuclease subunit B